MMTTFQVSDRSTELLGRLAGAEIREELQHEADIRDGIVIDFSGVTVMSPSFADECFGLLLRGLSGRAKPPRVVFSNVGEDIGPLLRFAVANRHPRTTA